AAGHHLLLWNCDTELCRAGNGNMSWSRSDGTTPGRPTHAVSHPRPGPPGAGCERGVGPELTGVLRSALSDGVDVKGVLLALQVARIILGGQPRAEPAEFVATVPPGSQNQARPTQVVLLEMLTSARRQIVALGYEITDRSCIELLRDASQLCPETLI